MAVYKKTRIHPVKFDQTEPNNPIAGKAAEAVGRLAVWVYNIHKVKRSSNRRRRSASAPRWSGASSSRAWELPPVAAPSREESSSVYTGRHLSLTPAAGRPALSLSPASAALLSCHRRAAGVLCRPAELSCHRGQDLPALSVVVGQPFYGPVTS